MSALDGVSRRNRVETPGWGHWVWCNPELARVLRDGPFATAFAVAVECSGLTLDRLRDRLAEQGVAVSRTTLSCWRSGRSRPERAGSSTR